MTKKVKNNIKKVNNTSNTEQDRGSLYFSNLFMQGLSKYATIAATASGDNIGCIIYNVAINNNATRQLVM
ncbi:MAG: hypothetical protein U0X86_001273 [Wolbachia endosymbiont of Xenopsylla cheopis]